MKQFNKEGAPLEKLGINFKGIRTEVCEAAADWWIDQMTGNKQNWDNGSQNEEQGAMMTLLGNLAANTARDQINPSQFNDFRTLLVEVIKEEYNRKLKWAEENDSNRIETDWCNVGLHTDYGPLGILGGIASKAGIPGQAFPCKTDMWISQNKISVSIGYAADREIIFSLEK